MKKIFLLIFVTFSGIIFYQIILGKNGLIEGYRIKKERENLLKIKEILEKRSEELDEYIKKLKEDPNALLEKAEELGFFSDDVQLFKVIEDTKLKDDDIINNRYYKINDFINEIEKGNKIDKKIKKIRVILEISFFLFFGFFILLVIFGIQNKDE